MRKIKSKLLEYYPQITLGVIFFLLLIDCVNYYVLTIFSNLLGFSMFSNELIKNKYINVYAKNSIIALNIINIINIIGCFINYESYIRLLFIATITITLSITTYKRWRLKKN